MIDYEKLKVACDLILKVDEKYSFALYVSCNFDPYYKLIAHDGYWFEDYKSIDDLIAKLQQLLPEETHSLQQSIEKRLNKIELVISSLLLTDQEMPIKSSCCAMHAGTDQECKDLPDDLKTILRCLKCNTKAPDSNLDCWHVWVKDKE